MRNKHTVNPRANWVLFIVNTILVESTSTVTGPVPESYVKLLFVGFHETFEITKFSVTPVEIPNEMLGADLFVAGSITKISAVK